MVLGLGMNSQRMLSNAEYVKETVRGKQILSSSVARKTHTGWIKKTLPCGAMGNWKP